ncbi:hypothetical protein VB735_24875 [Halotia wernerae UHCC 0503]|nr:hypothetical protein [Halotia wernerae UHCC 0503]
MLICCLVKPNLDDQNYLTAESFFLRGLNLVKADNFEIRYSLLKNLGWVQVEQNRHREAHRNLVRRRLE